MLQSHFFRPRYFTPSIRCLIKTTLVFMVIVLGLVMLAVSYRQYLVRHTPAIVNPPANAPKQSIASLQQQGLYADKVYVKKSTRTLHLLNGDRVLRSYHIALGDQPQGHKQQEGDERTPEGWYTLDWANEHSKAYRSLHISYPNPSDVANAKLRGVNAGGAIMIHGQMNGLASLTTINQQRDWTDGCIAVTNAEMDEIMALVKVGTPILIEW